MQIILDDRDIKLAVALYLNNRIGGSDPNLRAEDIEDIKIRRRSRTEQVTSMAITIKE